MSKITIQNKDIGELIRREVITVFREMINDPDFGLELTDYAEKKLKRSLASKKRIPLNDVLKKYKI